jgi:polar amino acid transport system permease protein
MSDWDYSIIGANLTVLVSGLWTTVLLTVLSIVIGSVVGALVAIATLLRTPLRVLAFIYLETFLSIPVLVLLIWLYYVLPYVSSAFVLSGFAVSVIGLSLSLSAFVADIVRAGIKSVPRGQLDAALILGVPSLIAWRRIVFPQALQTMRPALMGQFITTYKFSTLASVVTVGELLHEGQLIIAQTYRPVEIYSVIAVFFVVTIIPLNLMTRFLARRSRRPLSGIQAL